jgi:hypothetical protein
MSERKDYVKEFLEWIRGNRLIAFFIVMGIAIMAILNFKDIVQKALFPDECPKLISQIEKDTKTLEGVLAKGIEESDVILISHTLKSITNKYPKTENLKCRDTANSFLDTSKAKLFSYLKAKSKYWENHPTTKQKTELNQLLRLSLNFIEDNKIGDENDRNILHVLIAKTI